MQLFTPDAESVAQTTDDWYTPPELFTAMGVTFDVDVCAPINPDHRTVPADTYLTILEDGLTTPWQGFAWCNPPYSDPGPWVDRWVGHGSGLLLVPALPRSVWRAPLAAADAVTLINLEFLRPDGLKRRMIMWPLLLAGMGQRATQAIARAANADPSSAGGYWIHPRLGGSA